jgi:polyisoprenoid-binding protein YceI
LISYYLLAIIIVTFSYYLYLATLNKEFSMKSMMMLTIAALAFSANTAMAKKPAKAMKAEKAAAAEIYKIDTQASTIEWTGTKITKAQHKGTLAIKDGQLEVANKEISGGQFTAKMDSLTDKDLEGSPEYKTKLETHLKSEDFFNVAKYPESSFKIKSVKKKSDTEYTIKGDLTMIGKSQEVEFPAQVKMEDGKVSGTAELKIDRTKWDLKYGSGKFFKDLGDKMINDEIILNLNLVAKK